MFDVFHFAPSSPMRRNFLPLGVLIIAILVGITVSACSSDDPGLLPGDDAQQILANLDRVEELATNGECDAAIESIATISRQVENLPDSVSSRLRQNLRRGVGRLSTVTTESCGTADPATEEETVTVPDTTETETDEGDEGVTGGTGQDTSPDDARGNGHGNRSNGQGGNRGPGTNQGRGDRGAGPQGPPNRGPQGGGGKPTTPEPSTPPAATGGDDDSGGISPAEPVEPSGEEQP